MTTTVPIAVDESKLNAFMGRAVSDMGAAMHALMILIGDRVGLYKARREGS